LCRKLYATLQCYDVIIVDYITYSGYIRLSMYMWDILLTYTCRRLSSCLRSNVFWEVGRDRIFLVSPSGFWVVVSGMYGTHLKLKQFLHQSISNNIEPQLICVVGVIWDAFTACDNWYSLSL